MPSRYQTPLTLEQIDNGWVSPSDQLPPLGVYIEVLVPGGITRDMKWKRGFTANLKLPQLPQSAICDVPETVFVCDDTSVMRFRTPKALIYAWRLYTPPED